MKSKKTAYIFGITTVLLSLSLGGCDNAAESTETIQISAARSAENDSANSESASASSEQNSPAESTPAEPVGEPTFLIGLDGNPILTSEITRLENTDKTIETLTENDTAEIYCEGFIYLKEPSGIAYNSYKNPELFDMENYCSYVGEKFENTNEWKRYNVGDEICGLKIKKASVVFEVYDDETWTFPERYFSMGPTVNNEYTGCEFEGTVEIEGFLQVLPDTVQYAENSRIVEFYPCESKLPVFPGYTIDPERGYITPLTTLGIFDHFDFGIFGESDRFHLGYLDDITCDMDGIGKGDIAYARVTLGNINMLGSATLENVERLSDILAHDEDNNEIRQPAPTG